MTLTNKNKRILNILRTNARIKKTEIAKQIGVQLSSASTMIDCIERKAKPRYASLIDFKKAGYTIRILIVVDAGKDRTTEFLYAHQNINTLHKIDENVYLVEAVFKNMKLMADFTEELEDTGAIIKKEYHIIEDLKREEMVV